MAGDRTEKATQRQRQKATERGDRTHSRDLLSAAAMLGGVLAMRGVVRHWLSGWENCYAALLVLAEPQAWTRTPAAGMALALRREVLRAMGPLLLVGAAALCAAVAAGIAQGGGWSVNTEALKPKLERLNPVENLKNLFSLRGVGRLAKSLAPVAALTFFAARALAQQSAIPPMSTARLPDAFAAMYNLLLDGAWIFLGWAGLDYLMEWRSREGRLRMTRQELRDEFRETEGSPQIKARIRGLRRQLRRQQLRADVSKASVVVTNPTHFAVALSFDFETMDAPKVLTRGRDLLAQRIREEAQWAGVPVVENPPLARSLYRQVEQGQSIPQELYAAVAGILAWLYRREVEERVRRERASRQKNPTTGSQGPTQQLRTLP